MKKPPLPDHQIATIIQRRADEHRINATDLFRNPLPRHRRDLLPRIRREIIADLFLAGMPPCRIANLFRVEWATVRYHLAKSHAGYSPTNKPTCKSRK